MNRKVAVVFIVIGLFCIGVAVFGHIFNIGESQTEHQTDQMQTTVASEPSQVAPTKTSNSEQSPNEKASDSDAGIPADAAFDTKQNDTEGIDRVPWGSSIAAFLKSNDGNATPDSTVKNGLGSDKETMGILADLLGASTTYDWHLLPASLRYINKNGKEYIFYRDQLAMAIIPIEDLTAVQSSLEKKYPVVCPLVGAWVRPDLSVVDYEGEIFRRGSTNTHVLLFNLTTPGTPLPFYKQAVKLIYVPNYYWSLIQQDISEAKTQEENAKQKKSDEETAKDIQKIQ